MFDEMTIEEVKAIVEYENPTDVTTDWDVPEETYRAHPALNFHKLADFHRDPEAFHEGKFDHVEETDAMRFGTALHAKILEGDEVYNDKVRVFNAPVNPKTGEEYGPLTKTYKEALKDFQSNNIGKTIISPADEKNIDKLTEAYYFHNVAPTLLDTKDFHHAEMSVKGTWEIDGTPIEVKGRLDYYGDKGLVDVKTTSALTDASGKDKFLRSVYDYKYLVQLGFYHRLLTDCLGAPYVPCWLVAFERQEPNRIAVYRVSPEVVSKAREVVVSWLRDYIRATTTGIFESKFSTVQLIDSYNPSWDV